MPLDCLPEPSPKDDDDEAPPPPVPYFKPDAKSRRGVVLADQVTRPDPLWQGIPVLGARRAKIISRLYGPQAGSVHVWCRFCEREHLHQLTDEEWKRGLGHRVAHCSRVLKYGGREMPPSKYDDGGYWVDVRALLP